MVIITDEQRFCSVYISSLPRDVICPPKKLLVERNFNEAILPNTVRCNTRVTVCNPITAIVRDGRTPPVTAKVRVRILPFGTICDAGTQRLPRHYRRYVFCNNSSSI